jgi:hypothetical protein
MYELSRSSVKALLKKCDGDDILWANKSYSHPEVHLSRQRKASQDYSWVKHEKVKVIWLDVYVSMALLQILCKPLKIWT